MKKLVVLFVAVVGVTTAFALERTPEQIAQIRGRRQAALAAKGGLVAKPQNGNFVRIVSTQKMIDGEFIQKVVQDIRTGFRVNLEVSRMEAGKCPCEDVEKVLKQPKTGVVLLVVDDPKLPAILSAPENAWAILNVHNLGDDMPPHEVLELRVRRELCRALASACGVGLSYNRPCVMEPVYTKTDLDNLKINLFGPESISKMLDAVKLRGVQPVKVATYLVACQEGWAPAPTNDVQRAIYNQVKADKERGPAKPITISPPNKK